MRCATQSRIHFQMFNRLEIWTPMANQNTSTNMTNKLHEWSSDIYIQIYPDSQVATYIINHISNIFQLYLRVFGVSPHPHAAPHTTPRLRSPKELPSQARQGSHGESQPGQVPRPSDRPNHVTLGTPGGKYVALPPWPRLSLKMWYI